jgi:hypothetical protein
MRISQLPDKEASMHTFPDYAPRGDAQDAGLVRAAFDVSKIVRAFEFMF